MKTKNKSLYAIVRWLVPVLALTPATAFAQTSLDVQRAVAQVASSLLLIAVVIGVTYNIWKTTVAYGGIIGQGVRRVGFGILFFSIDALDRILRNFADLHLIGGIVPAGYESLGQDLLLLLGLFFVTLGFVKLSSAGKK